LQEHKIAKVIYDWLADDEAPTGIPSARIEAFRNRKDRINTIRVDSKVVHETDTGEAKSDESRWMRVVLDTVGKTNWTADKQGRPIYPEKLRNWLISLTTVTSSGPGRALHRERWEC